MATDASGIYGNSMATSYHGNQQTIISRLASIKPLYLRSVGVFRDQKSMLTHFQTQKQFSFVVDVSCGMEEWGGLREGLAACSCRIVCWWVQTAPGSCHLLPPLGQTASGCRHVAALDNGIVNSLKADSMNEHVGDPWEKGGSKQCKYDKSCILWCVFGGILGSEVEGQLNTLSLDKLIFLRAVISHLMVSSPVVHVLLPAFSSSSFLSLM